MVKTIHYLSEAKMIARLANEKGLECDNDYRLAGLYVQIAIAEELKRYNDRVDNVIRRQKALAVREGRIGRG